MCTEATACPQRFCLLNRQFQGYSDLETNAKGHALLEAAEREISEGIIREMTRDVRTAIQQELHLPRVNWDRWDVPAVSHGDQEAVEHQQNFWAKFFDFLHRRRRDGRPPLVVCSPNYIRRWVVGVVRWRSLSPFEGLNALIGEYLAPGAMKEPLELGLWCAKARCCEELLAEVQEDPKQLTTADEEFARAVAYELLCRFREGNIWQTGVVPVRARPPDPDLGGAMLLLPGRGQVVVYVDRVGFAREACPLLFAGCPAPPAPPPPTAPAPPPPQLVLDRIAQICEQLAANGSARALRHLCCLLFRPFYDKAGEFCQAFTTHEVRIRDGEASISLSFWLDHLVPAGQKAPREVRDKSIKCFGRLIAYSALYCSPEARAALLLGTGHGGQVLSDFWRLATGAERRHPGSWGGFTYREEKGDPPPGIIVYGDADPPEILVLDWTEDTNHGTPAS